MKKRLSILITLLVFVTIGTGQTEYKIANIGLNTQANSFKFEGSKFSKGRSFLDLYYISDDGSARTWVDASGIMAWIQGNTYVSSSQADTVKLTTMNIAELGFYSNINSSEKRQIGIVWGMSLPFRQASEHGDKGELYGGLKPPSGKIFSSMYGLGWFIGPSLTMEFGDMRCSGALAGQLYTAFNVEGELTNALGAFMKADAIYPIGASGRLVALADVRYDFLRQKESTTGRNIFANTHGSFQLRVGIGFNFAKNE